MRSAKTPTAPFASLTVPVLTTLRGILSAEKRPAESLPALRCYSVHPGSRPRKRAITMKGYYFAADRAIKRSVPVKRNSGMNVMRPQSLPWQVFSAWQSAFLFRNEKFR
jgi:hypothetical protein